MLFKITDKIGGQEVDYLIDPAKIIYIERTSGNSQNPKEGTRTWVHIGFGGGAFIKIQDPKACEEVWDLLKPQEKVNGGTEYESIK